MLVLPGGLRFDDLRKGIREFFTAPADRFRGARIRLDLGQRDLDMLEIRRLAHMLRDEFEAEVVGLQCTNLALRRMAERELKLKVTTGTEVEPDPNAQPSALGATALPALPANLPEESPTVLVSPENDDPEVVGGDKVLTLTHTVRSGAVIRFGGDIHVFGDVNPGAHLIAGGNIVVFGALKGLAHAGTRDGGPQRDGGDRAIILAFDLRPTQLRIGRVIGLSPPGEPDRPGRAVNPEVAFISDGSIVIEPYRGRLPGALAKESA